MISKKIRWFLRNLFSRLHNMTRLTSDDLVESLRKRGVKVGENVNFRFPEHTIIDLTRPSLIEMGDNLDINDNFTVLTHDFGTFVFRNLYHDFVNCSGKVKIGSNIYFGRDVTILKGVTIGDNCIIGLGSVVSKDIPANSVAVGYPAKVVCTIEEYHKKRKSACLTEAVEYAESIKERYGREPEITDFTEEWNLFLTKDEYEKNPAVKKMVDFRLKSHQDVFWNSKRMFDGFDSFIDYVNVDSKEL